MTISSYAELQSTLVDWTKRDDMASRIPLFISMGESAMNATLRLRVMETESTITLSTGASYATLPAAFLEPLELSFVGSSDALVQVPNEQITIKAVSAGRPQYYAFGGSQVDFNCAADQDYSLLLRYIAKLDLATDSTNVILHNAPFAYLYGALQAYARWIEDGEQLAQYTALFQQELRQLRENDARSRGSATLRTDLGAGSFDIMAG